MLTVFVLYKIFLFLYFTICSFLCLQVNVSNFILFNYEITDINFILFNYEITDINFILFNYEIN